MNEGGTSVSRFLFFVCSLNTGRLTGPSALFDIWKPGLTATGSDRSIQDVPSVFLFGLTQSVSVEMEAYGLVGGTPQV